MIITIEVQYNIGDIVYLKTDEDARPRIVFSYHVTAQEVMYKLCAGTIVSEHYEFEITAEKPVTV